MNTPSSPDSGPTRACLHINDLRAGYGAIPVLHGLSLQVHGGEIVGVLGHNGMGKSTLLKTAMGLLMPNTGALRMEDRDLTRAPPHVRARAGIGYVPQGRGILAALSAEENLRLAFWGTSSRQEQEALERVLALFPRLKRLLERAGGSLSGGEQQLLALARALMPEPRLLLLDEPTEGIQPSIVEEIAATLQRLRHTQGLSVLVAEQNLDFMLDCAERLLVLERGRIVGQAEGGRQTMAVALESVYDLMARTTSV